MSTNREAEVSAPATPGSLSPQAKSLLAQAGIAPSQQQSGQERVGQPEAPQELEVDAGGGVKRRVRVEDLVSTWQQRQDLDTRRQALERQMAEIGDVQAVRALREQLEGLSPQKRQQVLALLQGAEPDGGSGDDDSADAIVREAFGNSERSGAPASLPPELRREWDTMKQAVMALASEANGRHREQQVKTTGERVDALMAEFPVFRDGGAPLKGLAKDAIMAQIAAAGRGAPIEDVVHRAAARYQELTAQAQEAQEPHLGVPTLPRPPAAALTAKGLKSGAIRQLAMDMLKGAR